MASVLRMKRIDEITALVILVVSAFVIVESSKMTLFVEFAPGYGFFPFWLGILMAVLSLLLLIDAWRRPPEKDEPQPFPPRQTLVAVVSVLGAIGIYVALLEVVGYIIDTFLVVLVLLGVIEGEKWNKTVPISVLMTAVLYVVFQLWLGVNLPKNALGF